MIVPLGAVNTGFTYVLETEDIGCSVFFSMLPNMSAEKLLTVLNNPRMELASFSAS